MPDCTVTGCIRPANGKMCDMHRQRKLRETPHPRRRMSGRSLDAPTQDKLSPFARFVEACIALADAPSEDDPAYDLALDVTRKAACAWMRSLGWAPTETEATAESVAPRKVG